MFGTILEIHGSNLDCGCYLSICCYLCYLSNFGAIFAESTTTSIDLGPIFDCTTAMPFGILDYPSLTNCNYIMGNIKRPIRTYNVNTHKYSQNVNKFHMYHYQHQNIILKYSCKNIFSGPSAERPEAKMFISAKICLEAVHNNSVVVRGPKMFILTRVTNSYCHNTFIKRAACLPGATESLLSGVFKFKDSQPCRLETQMSLNNT